IRVYAVQPLSTYIDQSFTHVRWMATALSAFGLLALVLAAIGLYGVIAYRVSLRTREIGVRMALGAGRDAIFREVVLHGLTIAVVGVVIGEVLAIPASRALASVQAGIRPAAPSMHVAAAVLWVAVAFGACYVPARRASHVDPMDALRHEYLDALLCSFGEERRELLPHESAHERVALPRQVPHVDEDRLAPFHAERLDLVEDVDHGHVERAKQLDRP